MALPLAKHTCLITPVSVTNGATASGYVDCRGFKFATISLDASAANVVSNNCSVLKITEGDTTAASTAITELTGDGVGGFTIAAAKTSASVVAVFNLDLRPRKRYLKLTVTPITTQIVAAHIALHKGESLPVAIGTANCDNLVEL